MNRIQSDQWSLGQDSTPCITSSFTLPLKKGHSKDIGRGKLSSVKCGLGWRFAVVATNADTELGDNSSGNVLIPLQKTQYELSFDPHIINNTDLKGLTITTTVEHMTPSLPKYNPSKMITLPAAAWQPTLTLGRFTSEENYTGNATVTFRVDLPTTFNLSLPVGLPSSRIRRALGDSLMGHDLIDTKFVLFTRRTREDQPSEPRALFGNSHLLRGYSLYLDTLLDGNGFKESTEVDLSSDLFDDVPTDGYDYLSDSDLDSEDEDELPGPDPNYPPPALIPPQTPLLQAPIHPQTPSPRPLSPPLIPPRTPPPLISVSPPFPPQEGVNIWPHEEPTGNKTPTGKGDMLSQASPHVGKIGRRIIINDTAFRTWKSLLFYLYTGKLEFHLLGKQPYWRKVPLVSSDSPKCSPKSMFRLADKIDLPELQRLALDAIRRSLTKENVLDEFFSRFTSMYPKVQEIEVEFMIANLTPDLFQRFTQKLKLVVAGDLPHSFDVLSDLMQRMCNGSVRTLPEGKPKKKGPRLV